LAFFKPTKILDFKFEKQSTTWSREEIKQLDLFSPNNFKRVEKITFKFKYIFEDDKGKKSELMTTGWEIGALFWNCKKNNCELACKKVKEKYFDDFAHKKDLHFFLGTTKEHHNVSKNPFIIIGTFHPNRNSKEK
jgi:hypothetical protein